MDQHSLGVLRDEIPAGIREELRRADAEVFSVLDSSIPDEVTHYTSLAGFKGIIAAQEIWCTDLRQVNDSRECDYGMDLIRSVIARKSVPEEFRRFVRSLDSLFGAKEAYTFYISCFCSSLETPRMWQDYAESGTGCAIVFDAKVLLAACDGGKAYSFAPVIYDERTQIDTTTKVIDHAIQLQRKWNLPSRVLCQYWREEVAFWLLACGFRFKAPCWHDEQEVRMAVPERDDLRRFPHAGKTRAAVPFERRAVIGIVRGRNASAGTAEQIRDMLNRAGYKNDVPIS